ncbi:uncharacterized protein LOC131651041 [Vicia villosa]|uniref:uncharacterized protein LOC131651041 n=1 Tax=Vicia villosa TaxID=3911 RepID=UPI00273B7577|nr:uncharacterized protein LOC131651041 [Vicia villosa]
MFSAEIGVLDGWKIVYKAVEIGDFRGFKIDEEEEVNILKFADDTIIMADGCSDNLWNMKAIPRGFKMMPRLKINFHKIKLYGIQVGDWFLEAALTFLSFDTDRLPFKILGVKIFDSPRKVSMWNDLIKHLKSRLAVWKGMNLTIVGRVVLINSVLNAIHGVGKDLCGRGSLPLVIIE